jgi:hypothetical protein
VVLRRLAGGGVAAVPGSRVAYGPELARHETLGAELVGIHVDVDHLGEPRVRDGAVVALEVVLEHDLPVGRDLPVAPLPEAETVELEPALRDEAGQGPERLLERRGVRIGVDEDERPPGGRGDREEGVAARVEARLALRPRRRPQRPVQVVRPGVVGALEGVPAAGPLGDDVAPVPADVDEPPERLVAVADDDHGDAAREGGEVRPGLGDEVGAPRVLPGATEDPFLLEPEHGRVGVPVGRQRRARVERFPQAGRVGEPERSAHPPILLEPPR